MHYWIYQDSRILGPFAREDVLSVPGVGQGSLVCEGLATGAADQDWKPLDSIPELAGLLGSRAGAAVSSPSEFDSFGQFQETAHALLENIGRSDDYPSTVLQDPQFSALWGGLSGGDPGGGVWDRHRVTDLETSVFDLKSQLEEQVKRQDEMLEKLSEKQRLLEEKEKLLAEREKEAELLRGRLREADAQPLGRTAPADSVSELKARIAQLEARQASPAATADPIAGLLARIAQLEARGAAPLPPADPVAELNSRLADLEARAQGGAAPPRSPGRPAAKAPAARRTAPPPPPPPPADFQEETPSWAAPSDAGEKPPPAEAPPWAPAAASVPVFSEEAAAAPAVPDFKPVPLSEDLGLPPMRARTEDVPQFEAPPPMEEAIPPMEAAPPLEVAPPLEAVPAAAASAPVLDDGVPEPTPLRAVSEMPPAMEFTPPAPETAEPWSPPPPAAEAPAPAADGLQPPPIEDPGTWGAPPPVEAAFQPPEEAGPSLQLQPPPSGAEPGAFPEPAAEPMFAPPQEEAAPPPEFAQLPEVAAVPPPLPEQPVFQQEPPQTMLMGSTPTPVPGGDMLSLSPPQGGFPQQGLGTSSDGDLLQAFPGQAPTPMPIPLSDGTQGGWPNATPMPTMGQPDLPQSVMQGLGISSQATPMPGSLTMPGGATPLPGFSTPRPITGSFEDALRGTATPLPGATPVPTTAPEPTGLKQRLHSKKFLIGLGISLVVLVLLLIFFLRNPKQVAQMVDMAPKQAKDDGFNVDNVPGFPPKAPEGAAKNPFSKPPAGPAPAAAQPGVPPAQPPLSQPQTPGRDFIQDQSIDAMEMVKNYQLDKSRGTIAKMLEYYFLGSDHSPEWSAGALEANVWVVEYHVFKGGPGVRSKKPTATYQFEVDLVKKTVIGRNGSAQSLISGRAEQSSGRRRASIQQEVEAEMSSQKTPRRAAPTRPRPQPRRPTAPEQAPLPDEEELESGGYTPPAGGGFNNPGDDNVGMESE